VGIYRKNGKIRTDILANFTVFTPLFINYHRIMITFIIKILRGFENLFRAVFNTKTASLTTVLNYIDYSLKHPRLIFLFTSL